MLFSSLSFLFVFLPLTLAVYWGVRKSFRNHVLLLSSIVFYAWGEPKYFLVMLLVAGVNYLCAILLDRFRLPKR